jgi:hypothetical protein
VPLSRRRILNRWASGFIQSGLQRNVYDSQTGYATIRAVHRAGITGEGQVVNVADTGVDIENVFFYDASHSLASVTNCTNWGHRKIVRIDAHGDNVDYRGGHGTHVCGTVAGKAYCTGARCGVGQYNGIGLDAKLHVTDLGRASKHGDMSANLNLDDQALTMRSLGCHISSNSWSYEKDEPHDRLMYDSVAYTNPDIAYVFASGNEGNYDTVNCPSDAKNIIAIGGSVPPSTIQADLQPDSVWLPNASVDATDATRLIADWSLASPMRYLVDHPVVGPTDNVIGKIVNFGAANLSCETIADAERRGAVAILTSTFSDDCGGRIPTVLTLPVAIPDRVSILPFPGDESSPVTVAGLSSRGPARTGLKKPDFVVPGQLIRSAYSHGVNQTPYDKEDAEQSMMYSSGTSMATPLASGALSLVCQFLRQRFYPSFERDTVTAIRPTSSLLKAMLMTSTETIFKTDAGFGIPNLTTILTYTGEGLRLVSEVPMPSKSHHKYVLRVTSKRTPLIVSMSYVDPPLHLENKRPIYADLNLIVVDPTGRVWFGNGAEDPLSNSEKVLVRDVVVGDYDLHVISAEYPLMDRINYSMAIRGPFEHFDFDRNPAFMRPTTEGCFRGDCHCAEPFRGHDCQERMVVTDEYVDTPIDLASGRVQYVKVRTPTASGTFPVHLFVRARIAMTERKMRVFACTSGKEPSSIAEPDWVCLEAVLGRENVFELDHKEGLFLALWLGWSGAAGISVRVELAPRPVQPKDKAIVIGLVVLGLCIVSIVIILAIEWWRRRRVGMIDIGRMEGSH